MVQPQQGFEYTHQRLPGAALGRCWCVFVEQHRLGKLQVPVAVIFPDKGIEFLGIEVETVVPDVSFYVLFDVLQA